MSLPGKRKTLGRRLTVPPLPAGVAECQRWKAWGETAWQDKERESQGGEKEHEDSDHPRQSLHRLSRTCAPFPGSGWRGRTPVQTRLRAWVFCFILSN